MGRGRGCVPLAYPGLPLPASVGIVGVWAHPGRSYSLTENIRQIVTAASKAYIFQQSGQWCHKATRIYYKQSHRVLSTQSTQSRHHLGDTVDKVTYI